MEDTRARTATGARKHKPHRRRATSASFVQTGKPSSSDAIMGPGPVGGGEQLQPATSTEEWPGRAADNNRTHLAVENERSTAEELAIARKQVAFLPFLKNQFDLLVAEHADSKGRYQKKAVAAREQVEELTKTVTTFKQDLERATEDSRAKASDISRLQSELEELHAAKGQVEQNLKEAQHQAKQRSEQADALERDLALQIRHGQTVVAARSRQSQTIVKIASFMIQEKAISHSRDLARMQDNLAVERWTRLKLERKLAERDEQIAQLVELIVQSEEEQALMESRVEDLEEDLEQSRRAHLLESRLFQKERNYFMSQLRDVQEDYRQAVGHGVSQHVEWTAKKRLLKQEIACLEHSQEQLEDGLQLLPGLSLTAYELEQDLTTKHAELEVAKEEISKANEATKASHVRLEELEKDNAHTLEDLSDCQHQLAVADKDLSQEREQRRHISSLLMQSQAFEKHLQEEISSLQDDLVSYVQLQETHADLMTNLDRLMRTADLAEEDVKELARMNSELAGHNNPNQRIRQLEKLRNELAEVKKKHIVTQADLAAHREKVASLQAEVSSYKAVDQQHPKLVKHVHARGGQPLASVGFGHVSVRNANNKGNTGTGIKTGISQRHPVKSFLS